MPQQQSQSTPPPGFIPNVKAMPAPPPGFIPNVGPQQLSAEDQNTSQAATARRLGPTDTGELRSSPPIGITHPMNWVDAAQSDLQYGGDRTWVGRAYRFMGGQPTKQIPIFGKMAEGPLELARSQMLEWTGHPIRAFNERMRGIMDTAGPVGLGAAALAPEIAVPAIAAQYGTQKGLNALGANPEWSEAAGNTAGLVAGGVAGGGIPKSVSDTAVLKTQNVLGLGRRLAEDSVRDANLEAEKANLSYQDAAQKVSTRNANSIITNETRWQDAVNKYNDAVTQRTQFIADQESKVAHRQALEKTMNQNGAVLLDNIKSTENNVRTVLNGKYNAIRRIIGNNPLDTSGITDVVKQAQVKYLQNGDELRIFNDIMRQVAPQEATPSLNWAEGQDFVTKLGSQAYSKDLPGNVYSALRDVRNGILDEMQRVANQEKMGETFSDTRYAWEQMQRTFHDTRSLSNGGSPVAKAMQAVDPGYVYGPFLGKAGARAIQLLEQYRNFGANPDVARQIQGAYQEARTLPQTVKVPTEPKAPVRIDKPMVRPPEPPQLEPLDMRQVRREALRAKSETLRKGLTLGDIAATGYAGKEIMNYGLPYALAYPIGRRVLGHVLDRPSVMEMLTRPHKGDATAFKKLAGRAATTN